ncbi:hypothetical protein WR25_25122 [Diploscapter pachys]|uniref:C2H2-type domain-containing protein n=1 Tax=Diploscapter pachys TaxID=2018661 RepID=A0A2A2LBS5_9BILA|nr:hypothetical protein WR25_25122 [Diploscapter pachys]
MVVHNCEQCSKKFTHKRYLTKHVARMHTNRVEPELSNRHLTCSLCDKTFPRLSHLQRHQLTHLGLREWNCAFCQEKFVQKAHMIRHIARKHPDEDSSSLNLKSETNGKSTSSGNAIINNPSTSTGISSPTPQASIPCSRLVKLFPCPHCGNSFYNSFDLNRHVEGVHAIFRCDRCKETIEGRRALLQHSMRCREEAHVCANCSATFSNKSLLRSHESSCNKLGSFLCIACQSVFAQRIQLERHLKKEHCHDWKCKNCEKGMKSATELKQHIKNEHSKDVCRYCQKEMNDDKAHVEKAHWKKLQSPKEITGNK